MSYIISSPDFTPEQQAAERARLDTLPTCSFCETLIDAENGDENFGGSHAECFAESTKSL